MAELTPENIEQLKEQFRKLNEELKNLGGTAFKEMPGDIDDVSKAIKLMSEEIHDIKNAFGSISQTLKNTITDFNNAGKLISSINTSYSKLSNLSAKVQEHINGTNLLNIKELKNIQAKAKLEIDSLKNQKNQIDNKLNEENISERQRTILLAQRSELESAFNEQKGYLLSINTLLDEEVKKEININKNLGIAGSLYKGIEKTLSKLGVDSTILKKMNDNLRDTALKGRVGFKDLFKVTKEGFKEAMQDPMFQMIIGLKLFRSGVDDIKKAFEIFKEYNAIFTSTARSIGLSTEQLTEMVKQASLAQSPFEQNMFSAKQLGEAISGINDQLGLSVIISADTANEFASMANSMGLSASEATEIYRIGKLNNLTLKDTNKAISAGIIAAQKSTGVQVNARQVFQEIGKLSAGITAKFQQNPRLIAEAVAQAKALGTSLEQIDKIGESLLNWESSIENELKAELITGKQLNFERARAAALMGDQVALMNEIQNQVGTLNDFQNMNVIAQRSLAEAFGLSRDEMANMLKQQEVFNKLGDVSGKSAQQQLEIARERGLSEQDSLVLNLKQQAASEKLAATFDSLKIILADLVSGPFQLFIDGMGFLAKNSWLVYGALGAIAGISLAKLIGGLTLMVVNLSTALATAITLEGLLTAGAALIAIPALLGIAYGVMSSLQKRAEKSIPKLAEGGIVTASPGGKLVTVGEGGKDEAIIPLNTPRAERLMGGVSNVDLSPMIAAINEVRTAVNNLASRPSVAIIDGKNAFADDLGKTSALGTSQYKNSYNLA